MTDRELMQMALDALEAALSDDQPYISRSKKTVEALRFRLVQPEPEPVETQYKYIDAHGKDYWTSEPWQEKKIEAIRYLYTAPPQREWVGLTAKDLSEIPASCYEGAIWADAKLKEKNGF